MSPATIPAWTPDGLLPPIGGALTALDRAPYRVSLVEFVTRFGTTQERRRLLRGMLSYRAQLHTAGLVDGFLWIDGSFVEDVENLEHRAPRDIDVVLFFRMPPGVSQRQLRDRLPSLMVAAEQLSLREQFGIHATPVDLALPERVLIERATYWYSLLAHRRDGAWKGYVELDLAGEQDAQAAQVMEQLEGRTP